MANNESIVNIALDVIPKEVCLVPEKRQELTTEGGLDVIKNFNSIKKTVSLLMNKGIEVSLFIEPKEEIIIASKNTGASIIELHTGSYCDADDSCLLYTSPRPRD